MCAMRQLAWFACCIRHCRHVRSDSHLHTCLQQAEEINSGFAQQSSAGVDLLNLHSEAPTCVPGVDYMCQQIQLPCNASFVSFTS
jgi:hypothetical protein